MKRRYVGFAIASLLLVAGQVFGAYTLKISRISKSVKLDYPITGSATLTETIEVRHRGDAVSFFLTFSSGQSMNSFDRRLVAPSGDALSYQLYDSLSSRNPLLSLSDDPTADNVLSGSFAAAGNWQTTAMSYVIEVPADQYVTKDSYDDAFDVSLYEGDLSVQTLVDTGSVGLSVDVPELIELSVIPPGDPFDPSSTDLAFDFGLLAEGDTGQGDIVVRANAVFTLSLQSANRGVMANLDNSDASEIPYEFAFEGTVVSLASNQPVEVAIDEGPTGPAGTRYSFGVEILPYGMASEGMYEDSITVTVSSK